MTHHITSMLETHPAAGTAVDQQKLAECIEACFQCAQTCTACADACLAEDTVAQLTACIRKNADCADICTATGGILTRQTGGNAAVVRAVLEACRVSCGTCADECAEHAEHHEHCRVCAEACRRCEQACADLLASLD